MAGISIPSLILILVIVILLFGTKKLRNIGSDLGGAIRSFRKATQEDDTSKADNDATRTIEGESKKED